MRRPSYFYLIISVLFLLPFLSCSHAELYDSFQTGGNFTTSNLRVVQIDTFTTRMSTFKYDSIASTGDSRLLVGRYTDPVFGEVRSTAYAQFVPTSYSPDNTAVFDSIVLNLQYDGYYYGDTLQTKTISVQQLSKELRYKSSQDDFYNTSAIAASSEVLGTKTFRPYISKDSVTVRLNDAFGEDLFTKIRRGVINDVDQLTDYFKGLKISAGDAEDASVIGFNVTKCYMRFYYSFPGDQAYDNDNHYDFNYYTTTINKFFNHVEGNRTGTAIAGLSGRKTELVSSAVNNFAYVQAGTGITTKIRFPSIRNIALVNDNKGEVFSAKLKMKLNNAYYNTRQYLPDSLAVYVVDQNNDLVAQLTDDLGNAIQAHVDKADVENNEVYLTATVTNFVKRVLENSDYLQYGLVLIPTGFNSRTDRMIINGENNSNYKARLELIYTIYDE
ncbi:MAG: DUF4270 family protein [Bacteroidia bacterium]